MDLTDYTFAVEPRGLATGPARPCRVVGFNEDDELQVEPLDGGDAFSRWPKIAVIRPDGSAIGERSFDAYMLGFEILRDTTDGQYPLNAEHDVLYVAGSRDKLDEHAQHILSALGFMWNDEHECFYVFT